MPKKAREGKDTAGLLYYLYGPGKRDEHVDPHMVASWGDPYVEDPARSESMTIAELALMLDAPVHALTGKRPAKHVYHVAVRNDPKDRVLTDAEWARVAREMMHAAGIAPHGDDQACRWVAIRHADDHIHLVATKARQDDRQPRLRQDILKMHEAARRFEVEFGLRRLTHGDNTARKWSRTGEQEKAARRGLSEPVRETLQRTVREAAAAASSDADFFARLAAVGLRVKQRIAPDGNVTGYSVAMPGDRDDAQEPVWFPGARLAPDLSLPRVRERWAGTPTATLAAPEDVWRTAAELVRAAADQLGAGGVHEGAGDVAALGDLIVVSAVVSPRLVRGQMRQAAREFERASRAPTARRTEGQARKLYRESTYLLSRSVASVGRNDTAAALGLLLALVTAVEASRRWHEAQQHHVQAGAAGRAGRLLREAVEVTAGAHAARAYTPRSRRTTARKKTARRTAAPSRARLATGVVQEAVPAHARDILADPAWPALRARLADIESAGDDPVDVLATVAAHRELASADSVAEVLVWRLEGWQRRRSSTPGTAARTSGGAAAASGGRTGRGGPARKQGPPTVPPRTSGAGEQPKSGPALGR